MRLRGLGKSYAEHPMMMDTNHPIKTAEALKMLRRLSIAYEPVVLPTPANAIGLLWTRHSQRGLQSLSQVRAHFFHRGRFDLANAFGRDLVFVRQIVQGLAFAFVVGQPARFDDVA